MMQLLLVLCIIVRDADMLLNQNTSSNTQKNNMRTFNITEAAEFLGAHKETIRRMVVNGQLPGVKIGRSWRFIEQDLVMHMRNKYSNWDASQGDHYRSNKKWHSTKEKGSGGLIFSTREREYEKVLRPK